jgi:hypothetical protein
VGKNLINLVLNKVECIFAKRDTDTIKNNNQDKRYRYALIYSKITHSGEHTQQFFNPHSYGKNIN